MAIHKTGATIAVGKILRQAFDRRARNAGFIKRRGVAADDVRRRRVRPASTPSFSSAAATSATCRCRLRCAISVLARTAVAMMPNGRRSSPSLHDECDRSDNDEKDQNRDDAASPAQQAYRC